MEKISTLQLLFYFGVIFVLYNFLYKWLIALPVAFLSVAIKAERLMLIIKAIAMYVLTILSARLIYGWMQTNSLGAIKFLMPVLISLILVFSYLSAIGEAERSAIERHDLEALTKLERDININLVIGIGAGLLLFAALFLTSLMTSGLVDDIANFIAWVSRIPFVGIIAGIGGLLFMVNMSYYGLILIVSLFGYGISGISAKYRGANTGNSMIKEEASGYDDASLELQSWDEIK